MSRAEKRDQTRDRIVAAAVVEFAEHGFAASSTRDIAARAGVTQGLVTYHFASKDDLWRAAADRIFAALGDEMSIRAGRARDPRYPARMRAARSRPTCGSPPTTPSCSISWSTRAATATTGCAGWSRPTWRRGSRGWPTSPDSPFPTREPEIAPHFYYALAGAASLIFTVAPECAALTGVDPLAPDEVDRHVDLVVRLFLPD